MRTIWKYELLINDQVQEFEIPGWGATCLVGNQDGFANIVNVWCQVDTDKPKYKARFIVTATGEPAPDGNYIYAGGAICGRFVYHVWRNAVTEKVE